ncbi:ABC transporter ATP-binding protein [Haloarchaeobius iranensis]|uniref:ABC-type multidrug transport system, ATPase component n=1 Tax=Haloarchaeobius iranensis TaxID=996166 RepID=A0A1G9YMB3_9EURY|nr:ABC transporter ATP-binding protein [Haloarchaeobius iranensis]SDN10308.1 ABC-type multidrug transport system, ATPase component [Haloarchaeobius iranensis]
MSTRQTGRAEEQPAEQRPAVEVTDVSHSFDGLDVLGDVSFTVPGGTVACVVGPNGSGKTTLLRLVADLLEPDAGSVTVAGDGGRRVGYLAQQPAFRRQFTVAETVGFYGSLVGDATDVDAVLDRVGLSAVADRRVDALSGGMRRLLGLAQAMVGDPSVFVLDEPATGLDPTMARHLREVIGALAADGDAVLLSTHDLHTVDRIADMVLLVDRGELVAAGPPAELLAEAGATTLDDAIETLGHGGGTVGVSPGLHGGDRA